MKEDVSFNRFCDAFQIRKENFTYEGKRALFDYLEEYEESTGETIELDIIALCCEYAEYKDVNEYLNDYDTDIDREEYEKNDDPEGFEAAVLTEISEKTTLIMIDDNAFIIGCY